MLERIELDRGIATYKVKSPFVAKVIKNKKLLSDNSTHDTRHLVFDISDSNVTYVDGQSIGILAPGLDERQKRHRVRLYSIASCSYGDDGKGKTFSLCVKRVTGIHEDGTTYHGVCSTYLCDLKVGDEVKCTGPNGKLLCMPKDDKTKIIMIANGTGIAPFKGFLDKIHKHLNKWDGGISLYFGVQKKEEAYYMNNMNNEINEFANNKTNNINFTLKTAFSREQTNKDGERLYVQHLVKQDVNEFFKIFKEGNFALYVCGLKETSKEIDDIFRAYADSKGKNWDEMKKQFKAEKRWSIEVY